MTREATLAASLVIDFLAFLDRQGHTREAVCRAAGIDVARLDHPNARVPAAYMERLWPLAERLTGDSDVGLHSAESYNPGALGILGYVVLSCRTAGQALDRLSRYAPLLNDGLTVDVVDDGSRTAYHFRAVAGRDSYLHRDPRQAFETLAAGMVVTLQRLATAPCRPVDVWFRHPAPPSVAEQQRVFGRVRFGQPSDAVIYDRTTLQIPFVSADPSLLDVFESTAARALDDLSSRGGVSSRVLGVLAARLKGEVPPLSAVATELAMSERAVQRSLTEERTSYRQLVDDLRKHLAIEHLSRPGTSATDVAFLLGFSEPSAFTRAFRRWTGSPPTAYRTAGS